MTKTRSRSQIRAAVAALTAVAPKAAVTVTVSLALPQIIAMSATAKATLRSALPTGRLVGKCLHVTLADTRYVLSPKAVLELAR